MKKIATWMLLAMLFAVPAYANCESFAGICSNTDIINQSNNWSDDTELGLGVSAPKIIRVVDDFYFGPEVRKNFNDVDSDEGWDVYGMFTYDGTLINGKAS